DLKDATASLIESTFRDLEELGKSALEADGSATRDRQIYRSLDMRYFGQGGHSVSVSLGPGRFTDEQRERLEASFHQLHESTYGHRTDEPVQIVHFRVQAIGRVEKPEMKPIRTGGEDASHAIKQRRNIYWRELNGATPWPVYDRSKLLSGNRFAGPVIVEEPTATTVVGPGNKVTVGVYGDLIIDVARF